MILQHGYYHNYPGISLYNLTQSTAEYSSSADVIPETQRQGGEDLKSRIHKLEEIVKAQANDILILAQTIDQLRKNSSGQRVYQGPGYWQES